MPVHSKEVAYDRGGDVLYISLNDPNRLQTVSFADDEFETVNWERRSDSDELVGAIVWAYSVWNTKELQPVLEARLGPLPVLPEHA